MQIRTLVVLLLLSISPYLVHANANKLSKIVLDAGHGGHDVGARGSFSAEKDLTLAIVLKLGKIINDSMKGVQVVYTRTTDVYPTLPERHEIANKANADLFISVHINSTPFHKNRVLEGYRTVKKGKKRYKQPIYKVTYDHVTQANGTESYVLGLHRNSQKESAIGEYSEGVTEEPGMLNENDPMTAIIVAQYAQSFLSRSVNLGTKIQSQFEKQGRASRGVLQKGLEVLAGSAMPGVLVECGYVNNPDEETYLNSERGQFEVALAIFRGIREYKWEIERQ
jgi:N-acetylmuramoyl-L-alanine amidase